MLTKIKKFFKKTKNTINIIHPFKLHGIWVFTDKSVGLHEEAFVAGADDIIDALTEDIPNAEKGFSLLFSEKPFPGGIELFRKVGKEAGGTWYRSTSLKIDGWLCSALFRYFEKAPEIIYAQFKEKNNG